MTFRLVQTFGEKGSIVIGGRTFPSMCVLEDEDSMRLLLITDRQVRSSAWLDAHASGVAALIYAHPVEGISWCLTETFMEVRVEHRSGWLLEVPERALVPCGEELISYREMTKEVPEPSPTSQEAVPDGFVHLHCHSEFSPLDGLATVDEIVKAAVADGNLAVAVTDHGVCFPAGTLIRMANGSLRSIEAVKALDRVVTAEGRWSVVVGTQVRQAKSLVKILAWGHQHLTCTVDHPILTERGYVAAGELNSDDWIVCPRVWNETDCETIATVDYMDGLPQSHPGRRFSPSPTTGERVRVDAVSVPDKLILDYRLGRLIGLFLAEGCASRDRAVWTFGWEEKDTLALEVIETMTALGGFPRLGLLPKRNTVTVKVYSRNWAALLASWCGWHSNGKRLHDDLCGGSDEFKRGVFTGWIDGDGHQQRGRITGTTVSELLAKQMMEFASALGFVPSLTSSQRLNRQRAWFVAFSPESIDSYRWRMQEDRILRRVRWVESISWNDWVYNLTVVGDHSYVAEGVGVHNCAVHPHLQIACKKAGIIPIFGLEAYFVDDRHRRGDPTVKGDSRAVMNAYYHLTLWAMDDEGLRNLWAMSTEANREGFYVHPRMDWDTLERLNAGVMCSTGCLRGPVARPIMNGEVDLAVSNLSRLQQIFGDRLYIEIQTNRMMEQQIVNRALLDMAEIYQVPVIAACDSHYALQEDRYTHQVWIASQTNKDVQDEGALFASEDADYHMMTEAEVREALNYLDPAVVDQAVRNTVVVASRCHAELVGKTENPVFSKVGGVTRDVERLIELCMANWQRKCVGRLASEEEYQARFDLEMKLFVSKEFCGYMLMVADYCKAAKNMGILVGPGRGSGGGSLVAYLSDITEIDPIEGDLLFERFLNEGRTEPPDFDVDFPTSRADDLLGYIVNKYGERNVVRVGTHTRLKNKGVIRALFSTLRKEMDDAGTPLHWPDLTTISALITDAEADKAGKGMSWPDLWEEHSEELGPFREKYPILFSLADRMVGRLKTYGKHAAGFIISPDEPLIGRLPLRQGDDNQLVAEFDMDALASLGLIKFDLLNLRNLDTIQKTVDLIKERYGIVVNPYDWDEEYRDPQVWDEVSKGNTLGIFQIETRAGTKQTRRMRPQNIRELADVITLVRPGPMRSGLTDSYFRRKAGQEPITVPDPRLQPILAKTYGTILYQEDVMATCMVIAGYSAIEADVVRKILGKKQTEKVAAEGRRFIENAVKLGAQRGTAEALWAQLAEFAKYGFNRAHAWGYAVLGHWTAWLKFHYPVQFLTAALSTIDKDRVPEFINEARRMGYKVLPPDINESVVGFKATQMAVRYGLDSVKGVGPAAVGAILAGQPYNDFDDFMERKGAANSGVVKILASVGAFDTFEPNRRALERRLEWDTGPESTRCTYKDETVKGPNDLPCRFDWSSEPLPVGKSGKTLKAKPIPKKCTRACRNYNAPRLNAVIPPYTDVQIREREKELLGVYLSSTPFDFIRPEVLEDCATCKEIESGEDGEYTTVALLLRTRPYMAKNNQEMGFISVDVRDGDLDVTVLGDKWEKYKKDLRVGALYIMQFVKNARGVKLMYLMPL